jgi:hypothetical protein
MYSERMLFEYAARTRTSAPQQHAGGTGFPVSGPNMHPAITQDMKYFNMGSSTFDDFFAEVPAASSVSLPSLSDFGSILHPAQDLQMGDVLHTGPEASGLKYPTPVSFDQTWHNFADYVRF